MKTSLLAYVLHIDLMGGALNNELRIISNIGHLIK